MERAQKILNGYRRLNILNYSSKRNSLESHIHNPEISRKKNMITLSNERIEEIVSGVVFEQMGCKDEKIVIVFDADCELAQRIHQAHRKVTPNAEFIKYEKENNQEIRDHLMGLPQGSSVFLIQSVSFRIEDFRIRLSLFHKGIGCLEYSHLAWYKDKEADTFLEAIEYQGDEFSRVANAINSRFKEDDTIKIYSGKNGEHVLNFGKMEDGKINDGRFYTQKNRGGSVVCGEIFSEAQDLEGVNGEISIHCIPNEQFLIQECDPFTLTIENGRITKWTENTPKLFIESIYNRVKESEVNEKGEGECMIREAGFGLNPKISLQKKLSFVSVFERNVGFHISVGKKHPVYRKKFHKDIIQRYHIDIFSDLHHITSEKISEDGSITETVLFSDGKYQV